MKSRILYASLLLAASCAGERRFPLREPMWRDTDLDSRKATCRTDESGKRVCRPDEYVSSLSWDAADNVAFRPIARFFAVDPGGEAGNVNSLDEVPDSSWFKNRIGRHPMTADEVGTAPAATRSSTTTTPPTAPGSSTRARSTAPTRASA